LAIISLQFSGTAFRALGSATNLLFPLKSVARSLAHSSSVTDLSEIMYLLRTCSICWLVLHAAGRLKAHTLLHPIVPVAGGADAVELIANLRDRFQIVGLGGDIGFVGGHRQLLHVESPERVQRPLRNHQSIGRFR